MIYNIIGLSLDLIGVILLFKYGILPDNLWEHILMDNGMSEEDEKKHKIWSKVAMSFLVLGFLFQLTGSFIQNQESKAANKETQFENINLGTDTNITTGIKGNLKVKYDNRKLFYQLKINTKIKTLDSINNLIIELKDKDGFRISKINISLLEDENIISSLIKKDSISLEINNNEPFSAKNYLQINKWELLTNKK
ncbi:hypothetical protein [Flavobacterium dankookense]|uniref:Uncharacterized protein n=1 Tax=Flavobacterium dankookense TaxID=706186 RepID=A0A4R6QF85_9FLAO|nr:hypothetical protein [Flavobacterium dankookense]TDP61559.1 hypothetical protein BC748_0185 [Flavobacterium dankookense]